MKCLVRHRVIFTRVLELKGTRRVSGDLIPNEKTGPHPPWGCCVPHFELEGWAETKTVWRALKTSNLGRRNQVPSVRSVGKSQRASVDHR